jgi:isopentenyl phosphate kinase
MTQGLCFCYLPNTKSKWNKFKSDILDNSNYDHVHGGGGFSHPYVIRHKYFVKNHKCRK